MACTVFECLSCGHFSHEGFGSLHNPSCPKCESTSVQAEFDESLHSDNFDYETEPGEQEDEEG